MGSDSTQDTLDHIDKVRKRILSIVGNLVARSDVHDLSKLSEPEKSAFDILTPKLKGLTYGSEEYRACLRELKPALDHHYAKNSHHPEFYVEGVSGMSLMDLIEMISDWKAAGERHDPPNSILDSIEKNTSRFNLSPDLKQILLNTVRELGW